MLLQDSPLSGAGERPNGSRATAAEMVLVPTPREPNPVGMRVLVFLLLFIVAAASVAGYFLLRSTAEDGGARSSEVVIAEAVARYQAAPEASFNPALAPVEPTRLLSVGKDEARAINAAIPFSTAANPAAAPLRLALPPADLDRATDCLAAAAWYEAGDDLVGQQAVVQVVANRMRHPAFPKTICNVVFQGAERKTGCQFSFTCDGALRRTPSPAAWLRARRSALAGISGLVFAPVGYATHYHTDWVAPYWSAKVEKLTAVGTHLFFRWAGSAGRPSAFHGVHEGSEPVITALARLSSAHSSGALAPTETVTDPAAPVTAGLPNAPSVVAPTVNVPERLLRGNAVTATDADRNSFEIGIAATDQPGILAVIALDLCRLKGTAACTVVGRMRQKDAANGNGIDFYFFRDTSRNAQTLYWNCALMPRADARQCMPQGFSPSRF